MKQTLILLFAVVFTACNAGKKTVQVWSSLPDTDRLLVDSTLPLKTSAEEIKDIVEIFPDQSCQTVLGVGAALTHSSAYVFHHHLDSVKRDSLFRVLFTRKESESTIPVCAWEPLISLSICSVIVKKRILCWPTSLLPRIIRM